MKVLWLFNHPAPYKINFFNLLGRKTDLTAVFERRSEKERCQGFYYGVPQSFHEKILPGIIFGKMNNYDFGFLSEIKKNDFDVIVINGWSTLTEMRALRYLKKKKIPYIFAINGGFAKINEPFWKRDLKKKYLPGATLYLSPENRSSEYLVYYGVNASAIRHFSYSTIFENEILSKPLTQEEKNALREQEGINAKRLFVSVGSFIDRKNDDQLISLWEKQPKSNVLYLIGNGPKRRCYEEQIAKDHLENVRIASFKKHDEVLRYFRMADASIFLTKEDIYGHVVNESLSQGTPVIASVNANSAHQLIRDGKNGYLVDIHSNRSIENALASTMSMAMEECAISSAKENTIEKMVDEHLAVFEEFLRR